jgi:hypothetical protein
VFSVQWFSGSVFSFQWFSVPLSGFSGGVSVVLAGGLGVRFEMIKSISLVNFKSYVNARIQLAPLTFMIGANASGKSNALEAIRLLSWLRRGLVWMMSQPCPERVGR